MARGQGLYPLQSDNDPAWGITVVEVLPAILAHSEAEFAEKIVRVKPFTHAVQIDVMDGQFVPDTTWADPARVRELVLPLAFEVHLMVSDPEKSLATWAKINAERVWIHVEAPHHVRDALDEAIGLGMDPGIAINPETDMAVLEPFYELVSGVLVMGVAPGASGQAFNPIAIERVRELKEKMSWLLVEVDGGVNDKTAPLLVDAGVDRIVSASYLFSQPDIKAAIANLEG